MNEEQQLLRDAYLSELWPTCRELSFGERQAKRQADWEQRTEYADRFPQAVGDSTDVPGTAVA